jgi:thioredoxin 1
MWCGNCGPWRVISLLFEQLSNNEEFPSIKFYKVDIDEQPGILQEVGVRAVRCCVHSGEIKVLNASHMGMFVAFDSGEKFNGLVGAFPRGLKVRS